MKDAIKLKINNLTAIDYTKLIRKEQNTHKGTFGTVAIIGGNCGMPGALYLAGRAALLMGGGKVILAPLDTTLYIDYLYPELMFRNYKDVLEDLASYSVVVIGPGLGQNKKALAVLSSVIKSNSSQTFVFDADALNLIAKHTELHNGFKRLPNKIITPHSLEAARLIGVMVEEVEKDRNNVVLGLAKKFNAITLLKGHKSLICIEGNVYQNNTGNSALSTGGQGDSLCGMIAAFIACGMKSNEALRFAVYLHGKSADEIVKIHGFNGITASETTKNARQIMNKILYKTK